MKPRSESYWRNASRPIDLCSCRVMGILNVTPDSFSDGGRFVDPSEALAHAKQMVADGAVIIDVGAESTRPHSRPVESTAQIEAALPVIRLIRQHDAQTPISIDTRSADVAREAIRAGADIVNDVSAGADDPRMFELIRESGAGIVLMHMMGRPETGFADPVTGKPHVYNDVVNEIREFLESRISLAEASGVARDQIAIDPGIGFGKNVQDNLRLLARLREFQPLKCPLLVGASRKRFIGAVLDQPVPADRLHGSLAAAAAAVLNGARMIRAHDVGATVEVVRMCNAVLEAT